MSLTSRPILPWRFVAGVFLHFLAPAYILVMPIVLMPIVALLSTAGGASWRSMLDKVIAFSGPFLAAYAVIAIVATGCAALIDRLMRMRGGHISTHRPDLAVQQSERQLADAVALGRGIFDGRRQGLLDAIAAGPWHHDDPRYQAISRDLDALITAFHAADVCAGKEMRADLAVDAERSLAHIASALQTLSDEQKSDRIQNALVVNRYVELRYGPSDFSGESDSTGVN